MDKQVNNRFRQYNVTLPATIAQEIKNRAREEGVQEHRLIEKLVVMGLTAGNQEVTQEQPATA